jgi:hypothetical protein
MRLPSLDRDYWQLISGEARHARSPAAFWIPDLDKRRTLKVGQAAKLIFEIESENEHGEVERDTERMWVVVSEIVSPYYIGRLSNQPATIPEASAFYLRQDVEVPFLPEHVIDIDDPPEKFLELLFSEEPKECWPRERSPSKTLKPTR